MLWSRLGNYDRAALDRLTCGRTPRSSSTTRSYVPIERLPELRYEAGPWIDALGRRHATGSRRTRSSTTRSSTSCATAARSSHATSTIRARQRLAVDRLDARQEHDAHARVHGQGAWRSSSPAERARSGCGTCPSGSSHRTRRHNTLTDDEYAERKLEPGHGSLRRGRPARDQDANLLGCPSQRCRETIDAIGRGGPTDPGQPAARPTAKRPAWATPEALGSGRLDRGRRGRRSCRHSTV